MAAPAPPTAEQPDNSCKTEPGRTRSSDSKQWSDERLLATVRQDPLDEAALDVLVERHWKMLFSRCLVMTLNHQDAADLAQNTWCRVLRSRKRLDPAKRFGGYLTTIATNLWRDSLRHTIRAGPLAENRLISLNLTSQREDDAVALSLMDTLPNPSAAAERDRRHLAIDIDQALAKLSPLSREVLVARYLTGESCAEIAVRHGCTEQTVSGWVRAAVRQMKNHWAEAKSLNH